MTNKYRYQDKFHHRKKHPEAQAPPADEALAKRTAASSKRGSRHRVSQAKYSHRKKHPEAQAPPADEALAKRIAAPSSMAKRRRGAAGAIVVAPTDGSHRKKHPEVQAPPVDEALAKPIAASSKRRRGAAGAIVVAPTEGDAKCAPAALTVKQAEHPDDKVSAAAGFAPQGPLPPAEGADDEVVAKHPEVQA